VSKLNYRTYDERNNATHLIIQARAGTGKTTTLIEGLKVLRGETSKFTPSEQQAEIWDELKLSSDAKNVCFVAFNKSIADELKARVPQGCDAMTMHSMGMRTIGKNIDCHFKVEKNRVKYLLCDYLNCSPYELNKEYGDMPSALAKLVSFCKMELIQDPTEKDLHDLCSKHDIEPNGSFEKLCTLVPVILEMCMNVEEDGQIDFNDMIWLPIIRNFKLFKYDLLLVDESQDLNRCQQELAMRAGSRLILCGDSAQAIYGFAGADAKSLQRMQTTLQETKRGCTLLPLTVTRRCGKAIVEQAKRFVPDFEAHETCHEGLVSTASYESDKPDSYHKIVQSGDMVLCRCTAPLIQECLGFIKQHRKANIIGRDMGAGLITTINKMKCTNISDLVDSLQTYFEVLVSKEMKQPEPNENRLIALADREECLMCFINNEICIEDVIKRIQQVFAPTTTGIILATVHKSKGLEADRVFILEPEKAKMPHPMAKKPWQIEQEYNLLYVAITRAISELVYVR
jgi:superfamily I DNA/RNA helicase